MKTPVRAITEDVAVEKDANNVELIPPTNTSSSNKSPFLFGTLGFAGREEESSDNNENKENEDHEVVATLESFNNIDGDGVDMGGEPVVPLEAQSDENANREHVEHEVDAERRNIGKRKPENEDAPRRPEKRVAIKLNRKNILEGKKKVNATFDKNAKKRFKDNVVTVKFKLSILQSKVGTIPDFAIFIKDDIHDRNAKPPAGHAGKYITFAKGNIADKFFSEEGISFNQNEFFICKNEIDLEENRSLPPMKRVNRSPSGAGEGEDLGTSASEAHALVGEPEVGGEDSEEEEDDGNLIQTDSDISDNPDIYNMAASARKVAWGAPEREHSSSSSSRGVNIYGRGAEKVTSVKKKKKRCNERKRAKEASAMSKTDILDSETNQLRSVLKKRDTGSSRGTSRGRGRGGRGRGTGKNKPRQIIF